MVAGSRRFCTKIMEVTRERALVKTGAEGIYCASLPTLGLGVALKVDDGAGRAAEVLMGRLLHKLGILGDDDVVGLSHWLNPQVKNRVGLNVGEIRPLGPISF
jgi:L-asparaginase II